MRVLHVLEAVGGGTMRHLQDLLTHTPGEHHVACPSARRSDLSHPDPVASLRARGAIVHTIAMSRHMSDVANLRAVTRLWALVRQLDLDIIHAHASVAGAIARVVAPRQTPLIWTPHAVQVGGLALAVERRLRTRADAIVALSESEAERALEVGIAHAEQICLIRNGVSSSAPQLAGAALRSELAIPSGVPLIGFIGRFSEQKRPLDFLAVAQLVLANVPEAHVVMVGSGPLLPQVLSAASDLPTDRFHHHVIEADAGRVLPAFDVLVTPSAYEGGPYLPLEAMAAHTPVVASDCVGLRDYVVKDVSGLTLPVGDVLGMSDAVVRLLRNDAERKRLVQSAHDFVAQRHDIVDMARNYQDLYAELAGSRPAREARGAA